MPVAQVQYQDLIGQPTWIAPYTIQFKTVMRNDIHIGYQVSLPPSFTNVAEGAMVLGAGAKFGLLSFQGTFSVIHVRHTGTYENPDGNAWCTIIDALDVNGAVSSAAAMTVGGVLGAAENVLSSLGSTISGLLSGSSSSPSPQSMVMTRNVRRY
jgi:hypothetical protein